MITEAQGMRISFKELLLLKGIVDASGKYTDSQGVTWANIKTATRGLSGQSSGSVIDRAIGNGLVTIDDDLVSLTNLGAKLLKAAEPSYAAKLKEALEVPSPHEVMKGSVGQEILDAARADDIAKFCDSLESVIMGRDAIWKTSKKVHDLMKIVRKGKKLYTVFIDYSQATGNEETHLRRNTLDQYKKQGYTLFHTTENLDGDELVYYK